MKKLILFSVILVTLSFIACEDDFIPHNAIVQNQELANDLLETDTIIYLEDDTLLLDAFIWRDFMPVYDEMYNGVICINQLYTIDSSDISSEIILQRQILINESFIWADNFYNTANVYSYMIEGRIDNGPTWDVGSNLHVICEFEYKGETYQILKKNVTLVGTY